jgi:hypothetical protein
MMGSQCQGVNHVYGPRGRGLGTHFSFRWNNQIRPAITLWNAGARRGRKRFLLGNGATNVKSSKDQTLGTYTTLLPDT